MKYDAEPASSTSLSSVDSARVKQDRSELLQPTVNGRDSCALSGNDTIPLLLPVTSHTGGKSRVKRRLFNCFFKSLKKAVKE